MILVTPEDVQTAFRQLSEVSEDVAIRDNVLMYREPLGVWNPVTAYDVQISGRHIESALILTYTYTKWSVFYYIHGSYEMLQGVYMFKIKPVNVSLLSLPFIGSYACQFEFSERCITYLVPKSERAYNFALMWNTTQRTLTYQRKGSLHFQGEQAYLQLDKIARPFKIHHMDTDGCDTYIQLVDIETPIFVEATRMGISPETIIRLERKNHGT